MAEEKEQLKIEAELDTSKLKQDAKQGFDAISKEEKKVQQDSKQTSKAIDDIGTASKNVGKEMQTTAQQSTSALKTISNEAKNTTNQIDNIAKATKQIKLQQALGIINKGISELAPVGRMIGKSAGMSDDDISLAGAGISGAMSGAMIGASVGGPLAPLTAAGGALIGAATSLISAADELKKSAKERRENAQSRYEANIKGIDDASRQEAWNNRLKGYADALSTNDQKTISENKAKLEREIKKYETENLGLEFQIRGTREYTDQQSLTIGQRYSGKAKQEALAKLFNESSDIIEADVAKKAENSTRIAQLQKLLDIANNWKPQEEKPASSSSTQVPKIQLPDNKEQISDLSKLLSNTEKLGSVKLSDSLTRVGGGSGYGIQMNGIATKVTTITNTLKSMLDELKKMNSNESVNSSEGVFVQ